MAVGCLVHMLGDMCTERGLRFGKTRIRLATINTGSWVEKQVVFPATWVVTVWWLLWWELGWVPGPHDLMAAIVAPLLAA